MARIVVTMCSIFTTYVVKYSGWWKRSFSIGVGTLCTSLGESVRKRRLSAYCNCRRRAVKHGENASRGKRAIIGRAAEHHQPA
jgi:hypothetical protein